MVHLDSETNVISCVQALASVDIGSLICNVGAGGGAAPAAAAAGGAAAPAGGDAPGNVTDLIQILPRVFDLIAEICF